MGLCRALCTDHGAFVVINVYCPNAGSPPERARLPIKMRFLEALKRKADELAASGREVIPLFARWLRCSSQNLAQHSAMVYTLPVPSARS